MRARSGPPTTRLAGFAAGLSAAFGCSSGADSPADSPADSTADSTAEADAAADGISATDAGTEAEEAVDGAANPCLQPGPGTVDAEISFGDGTPLLSGGVLADGRYELRAVVLHARAALADRVTRFTANSNGNTRGAVVFRDGAWGMTAHLDLYFIMDIVAVGGVELDVPVTFEVSGPFETSGGALATEPGVCAGSTTPECRLDGALRYEAQTDVVELEVLWTKECLTSLLPYGYSFYAGMWLEHDLPVVLRFSR